VGSLLSVGLIGFLIWQNWSDFIEAIGRLPFRLLVLLFGLALLSRVMVTLRWFILLRLVEPEVTIWTAFKLSFLGLFTTNVLPSTIGGDLVKLIGANRFGLDSANVAASLVVDRLLGMASMATFLPFGMVPLIQAQSVSKLTQAATVHLVFTRLWKKLWEFIKRVWQSLKIWLNHPMRLLLAAATSYIHMACTFTMVLLIVAGLGEHISWWRAGGLWVFVYFITLIPISINGLGVQEVSLSFVYSTFAGISEANSLVLALLIRILFMMASLPGALFLPGILTGDWRAFRYRQMKVSPDD
jgi:hypothetical protein